MLRIIRLRRRLNDLSKALVYRSDAPMHLPALLLPFYDTWRDDEPKPMPRVVRRFIMAYFAWHGHHVSVAHFDIKHDDYGPLVGIEGVLYPLRPQGCPFSVYETAIIFIRDGQPIPEAFETAELLDLY